MIKLGGHVFPSAEQNAKDPELLAHLAKQMGYQAAYAPDYLTIDKPDEIRIARKAFEKEGILIAEAAIGKTCWICVPTNAGKTGRKCVNLRDG